MTDKQKELAEAQHLVQQYGQILSHLDATSYAHPQSLLPCDKDQLKSSLQLLLWEIGEQDKSICESLVHAYTFLAQFIDDDDAELVARSQAIMKSSDMGHDDWNHVETATRLINDIKLEMEELLKDVKPFIS
ncbi:MAG: hypothetical protein P8Y24_00510 [Gammaproteobacteria bacterium]|jgi:hypothetical protein